jgi:hypothetical protein
MSYSSFFIDADPCCYKDSFGESATIDLWLYWLKGAKNDWI